MQLYHSHMFGLYIQTCAVVEAALRLQYVLYIYIGARAYLTFADLWTFSTQLATLQVTCSLCGRLETLCKWTPLLCPSSTSDMRILTTETALSSMQEQVGLVWSISCGISTVPKPVPCFQYRSLTNTFFETGVVSKNFNNNNTFYLTEFPAESI